MSVQIRQNFVLVAVGYWDVCIAEDDAQTFDELDFVHVDDV